MVTLTVSLSEQTKQFLEQRAESGGHADVGAYLDAMAQQQLYDEAVARVTELMDEGVRSGFVDVTPEDWAEIRREVEDRIARQDWPNRWPGA